MSVQTAYSTLPCIFMMRTLIANTKRWYQSYRVSD